jgi:hypothetical protein
MPGPQDLALCRHLRDRDLGSADSLALLIRLCMALLDKFRPPSNFCVKGRKNLPAASH